MEKILRLYTYVDGTNDTPFPSADEQVIIGSFTYTANRMGSSPTITATVKHRLCLDDLWNDKVYAEFNGERYFVINTPSSSKNNDDTRYEHDLELLSEREILNHVYFIDAVQGDSDTDVYKSNSTKVLFYGDIQQFVARLNASLSYRDLEYTAVIDEGITSEDKQVSFEDKYISEALQEEFNIFEIPYYFIGKVIHFGYTSNAITTVFKYGYEDALLSISKENANYALINRITGVGSSENIPYYYPNPTAKGTLGIQIVTGGSGYTLDVQDQYLFSMMVSLSDVVTWKYSGDESGKNWWIGDSRYLASELGIVMDYTTLPNNGDSFKQIVLSYINPSQNLMPSIYRETQGAERFYNAKNDTYQDGEGGYYEFENEYSESNPREGMTNFENIKPTITGITNAAGQRIDMFSEFAYDTNDNDEVDEEGNYLHPYFFAKLKKTDGAYGFNLFDHAIESQTMQITFTSGVCGACMFEIAVGEDTQKNLVQVSETSGALMRDEDGNVLCGREDLQQPQTPQDRQNDTQNYEVWIALRKDDSTYPQVMPNVNYNYKPSTSDTFAILGISLPQAYILKAEDELEKSLIKHMWNNNVEKFTFSSKFSRVFFTEHPDVLTQLNENARVLIEYNNKQHTLYIDNYTYKMDSGSPLPEIDIDLVDTLSVGQNSLQTQLDSVKQDILSSIGGGDFLKQGLKYFLRKDTSDTARGKIAFVKGLDVGTFVENTSGGTFRVLEDLTTYAEVDRLRVRVKAYFETLEVINTNSLGGKMILTAGGGVYLREVKDRETLEDGTEQVWDFYRCYFLTEQDGREVENRFHVGDLAMSQSFNIKAGINQGVTNHYYWREVVGVGDDYIDLSKTICDTGSDAPMAEDTVCHLGNRSDKDRQGAIIFSAVDVFSPSITLYYGINDFSLVNKDYVSYGIDKTSGNAFFRVYGEMYTGDREQTTYMKYTPEYGVEIRGKLLTQTGKDIENTLNSFQDQIDGVKETFYGEYTPTVSNAPASEWTTEEEKARHEGDVFTNIQEYVDDETTPDAGKSWRWVKNDETGEWYWLQIADSDTSKAYLEAAKANQAAQEALESVNQMQDTVDGMRDFTDTSFADGIVSRGEASSISAYIKNINTFAEDVSESYTKVYSNPLLEGTDKTNLENAYIGFNTAKDELISTINSAISDGQVDSIEKASVDGKYDAFNIKYGDFVAYLNAANKYIQDVINKNALDALDKIGEFDYLRAALKEYTSIEGGLIQSSTLALGYTSDDGYVVMAGTNGIYDSSKLGGGIASWWGGGMFDRFEYTEETMPENVAKGLIRMDGTGYFANGNLWWEADGTIHADPQSFIIQENQLGDYVELFQIIKSGNEIQYAIPKYPFQKLEVANYLQVGHGRLYWDEEAKSIYIRHEDGVTKVNFYTEGEVSAGGKGTGGDVPAGVTKLSALEDVSLADLAVGQVLQYNGEKWVNANASGGISSLTINLGTTSYEGVGTTDVVVNLPAYPTSLPASDVHPWAKQPNKPSYTAAEVGALTQAAGDGRYVKKSGDTINGVLYINNVAISGGSFNEGLRINRANTSLWATIAVGGASGSTSGTSTGTWSFGASPASRNYNLIIAENGSDDNSGLTLGGNGSSTLTWKGSTIWHSGNDGSGSGLDADLLDGTHKSGLLTSVTSSSATNLSIVVGGTTKSVADIYATYASQLQTARTLWGQSFNGTANVTGNMSDVGTITMSGALQTPDMRVYNNMSSADYRLQMAWSGEVARIYAVTRDGTASKDLMLGSTATGNALYYDASTHCWGIGTNAPAMKLHVAGDARFDGWIYSYNAVGWYNRTYGGGIYMTDSTYVRVYNGKAFYVANNIVATGEVSAGNASDRRLKSNITTLTERETAHVLSHLNPVSFTWNAKAEELSGGDKKGIARSFVADEFLSLLPNAGRKMWNDYDAIYTEQVVPYVVKGWQMHERRLSDHERRIQELEKENRELKRQLRRVA